MQKAIGLLAATSYRPMVVRVQLCHYLHHQGERLHRSRCAGADSNPGDSFCVIEK